MVKMSSIRNGWRLLDSNERKESIGLILVVIISAVFNVLMVGSVWPFLEIIGNPAVIFENKYYEWIYNYLSFSSNSEFIIFMGICSFSIIIISTLVQVYRVYAVSNFALMKSHSLSLRLFRFYMKMPYEYHTINSSSTLETNLLSETQHVVQQLYRPAANIIASIASVCGVLFLLLVIDLYVSLAVFSLFGLFYFTVIFFTKKVVKNLGKTRHTENNKCFNIVSEALSGMKSVKANTLEEYYISKFDLSAKRMAQSQVKAQVYGEAPNFLLQGITFGGMIIFTILLVDFERLAVGGLTEAIPLLGVFAFAGQRLIPELQRIFQGYTQFQYANESANNLVRVLESGKEYESQESNLEVEPKNQYDQSVSKSIRFENLSYKYPSANIETLKSVNLDIPIGSKVGVVGTTGAGKTTFVDLMLGLLSPTDGLIKIGDMTLNELNLKWWLSQCSYLPQDVFLIDDTIQGNITFGQDGQVNEDKLSRVLDIANINEFLGGRSDGINSVIGENGVQLSGGQRQRIGLARALYKNSKVIILDEATSALDNETEKNVLDGLYANIDDVTVFIIAHRLTSIRNCDTILVFNEGVLVGKGTWDDLVSNNYWFKRLVSEKSAS